FSRVYLFPSWVSIIAFVMAFRLVLGYAYIAYRRAHNKFKEVIVVGANPASVKYTVRNLREPRLCTRVDGVIDDRFPSLRRYKRLPVLGRVAELEQVLKDRPHINEVVVTAAELPRDEVLRIMLMCEKHLVGFKWLPDILGLVATQMK